MAFVYLKMHPQDKRHSKKVKFISSEVWYRRIIHSRSYATQGSSLIRDESEL